MQRIQNERGFSMIEVLVASAIVLFVALISLSLFVSGYQQTATSGRVTTAINAARTQMEAIRNTPFDDIPTLFPPNEETPGTLADVPNGRWTVAYPQGTQAQPLAVQLKVQWIEDDVPHELVLDTLIANVSL